MNFIFKPVNLAVVCCFSVASLGVQGQAIADETVELEEYVVTGSYISRPEMDSIAPVAIIDRETIERSGAVTISEFFQKNLFTTAGFTGWPASTSVSSRPIKNWRRK